MTSFSSDKRILVVDDEKLAGLIREYLTPIGYDVTLRHRGDEGLATAQEEHWDAVILDGEPLELTALEFAILLSLMKANGRVKSREQLIEEVSERKFDIFDRSIDVHISALRKKLKEDAREPRFIRTVRAVGYQLVAQVTKS